MADGAVVPDVTVAEGVCHLLSRVFIDPPDAAMLQSCREGAYADLLRACARDPAFAPGARRLAEVVETAELPALSRSWMLLFSGAGGPATVPPYASAAEEGRLYGAATARMQALLAALDLSVAQDCPEPADHIAIQLTVLAALMARGDVAAAERFRRSELGWAAGFCEACAAADRTGFYAGAALLLAAVTQSSVQGDETPC